jgi:hypothetical protein
VATALEYYSTGSPTKATGTFVAETVDAGLGAFVTAGLAGGAAAGTAALGLGAIPGAIIGGLGGAVGYLAFSRTDTYQDAKTSVKTGTESVLDGFDWAAAEQAFAPYVEMQNSPGLSYQLGTRFGEWLRGR